MVDGEDHGREYEANSRRAHVSAFVLVAGLVLELINAVIWYKGPETMAEMVAVLLIVGGVWGKIFFGNKARLAGDKQLAQYEANTREANARAAEAGARAAEANQKAEEARLELAKYRAPRTLSIPQQRRIAEKIRMYQSIQFDSAVAMGNTEAITLLEMIEGAVRAADWTQLDWRERGAGTPLVMIRPGFPRVGNTAVSDVLIQYEAEERQRLEAPAQALASALSAEGVSAVARANMQGVIAAANTAAIHIFVGEK